MELLFHGRRNCIYTCNPAGDLRIGRIMLRSANNLAFSAIELCMGACFSARDRTFHGFYVVVVQKIATAVCSACSSFTIGGPTDLTSFTSLGVSELVREMTLVPYLIAAFEH